MTKPPAPRSRLRPLSEEDIALWLSVAESVERRPDRELPRPASIVDAAPPVPPAQAAPAVSSKKPAIPQAPPLAALDRRLKQKLSRGRMTADAAIDLHGFRQEEALGALRRFLRRQQQEGARVVLVVTGKGGRPGAVLEGGEIGVLRRVVPLWLAMPEFRTLVVGYEEAGRHHGGSGALYVRLRRPRDLS